MHREVFLFLINSKSDLSYSLCLSLPLSFSLISSGVFYSSSFTKAAGTHRFSQHLSEAATIPSHESKQKQRQMLMTKGSQNSPILMQFISDSDDDDEARR